jgi:extracellular factor (EF) 3-hydroxypalmitic acid methyl ester biosynthesis protein
MSALVAHLFESELPRFLRDLENLSQQLEASPESASDDHVSDLIQKLDAVLAVCGEVEDELADDPRLLRSLQERFRDAIQPWFSQSWFIDHALRKPHGYPGDYEILTAIYDGQPRSQGLGWCLDRYFLQTELARSIPVRLAMAREFLIKEARQRVEMSVLNIASGPGREYRGGWNLPDGSRVRVTCVDQDDEALSFIRRTVIPTLPFTLELECVKYNALKMGSSETNREVFGRPDVVYSIGLCDYIPDRLMIRLLRGWRETAAEGGVVYVAFKDCLKYDKTKYQWPVDWYFYQRTTEECRALFEQAGYDIDSLEMTRDGTGSIINFISRIPERTRVRIDESQCARPSELLSASHADLPVMP